ncbi:MAG: hypothetical protein BJ554DRAFT_8027 [Olpidium bornovanus]|uniref:Uncharacterized protein n=1 Tax=Olpidium bornovanus TaxID=278681 RepID=A0A8H7ZV18_9FUNG|nr:MAG: hypothetical protein BJ554DRAFT_8027 [Olpidium bornovanus]
MLLATDFFFVAEIPCRFWFFCLCVVPAPPPETPAFLSAAAAAAAAAAPLPVATDRNDGGDAGRSRAESLLSTRFRSHRSKRHKAKSRFAGGPLQIPALLERETLGNPLSEPSPTTSGDDTSRRLSEQRFPPQRSGPASSAPIDTKAGVY